MVEDIAQLKKKSPDRDILGIDCGDLVGDKPELYPLYIEHLNRTGIPFYRMPGNHDLHLGGRSPGTISVQTINISALFDMLKPYNTNLLMEHMHYTDSLYL